MVKSPFSNLKRYLGAGLLGGSVSEAKLGQRLSLKAERQGDGLRSGGAADGGNRGGF